MGNFSRTPLDVLLTNRGKRYVGLHIEQGVPVLDRDLNLLNDLISSAVREIVSKYIGDGMAVGREGFAIQEIPADNDFVIRTGAARPGTCLLGGIEVSIDADIHYSGLDDLPPLTTPAATHPDPRTDIVFLDVWLREVDGGEDPDLLNSADVGIQTSVRQAPAWMVRVAEGVPAPEPQPGHAHYPLAQLVRPRHEAEIRADMITDLRESMSTLPDVQRRLLMLESLLLPPAFNDPGSQFSPFTGDANEVVTLYGSNFTVGGTPQVLFDSTVAAIKGAPTAGQIKVRVPAGVSGAVNITVNTDGGSVVSDDVFTVL